MTISAFCSFFFGITWYSYFWFIAVPVTTICYLLLYAREISSSFISKVLWLSIWFLSLAYWVSRTYSYDISDNYNIEGFISSLFVVLSSVIITYFVTDTLPKLLTSKSITPRYFDGFYRTTTWTLLSIFSIDLFTKYWWFWDTDEWFIIFPCIWLILFFFTPYIYLSSFKEISLVSDLPSTIKKILFTITIALIYLSFVYINRMNFHLPNCC